MQGMSAESAKPAGSSSKPHNPKGGAFKHKLKEPLCTRCGRARHTTGSKCSAIGATSHKCKKKRHFSARCLSKSIATVSTSEDEERAFLGAVTLSKKQKSWLVEVQLNEHAISVKMDTGAEVTTITEETYQKLGQTTLNKLTKFYMGQLAMSSTFWDSFLGS